jgi:Protein of unknown function (DUF1360)
MPLWVIAVYALAVARVTRFLVADDLIADQRQRVIDWLYFRARPWITEDAHRQANQAAEACRLRPDGAMPEEIARAWSKAFDGNLRENLRLARGSDDVPKLVTLATCPWCMSIWVGAGAALLAWFAGRSPWLLVPALALAFSYVTGWLSAQEGK